MGRLLTAPKRRGTIKKVGQAIIIVSAIIIFGNGMGILSFSLMGFNNISNTNVMNHGFSIIDFIFDHYTIFCSLMIIIGSLFLYGGIFLSKYRLWTLRFLTIMSGIIVLIIWALMISMFLSVHDQIPNPAFLIVPILTGLIFSVPFILLIWFLNDRITLAQFRN